jgi:hypothetical protein
MARKRADEPLFDTRRYGARSGRNVAALERSLRALRDAGALETVDAVRVAVLRTLAEAIDTDTRRPEVSSYTLATATRTLTELFNALAAGSDGSDAFDDLVTALSASPRDPSS